MKKIARIIVTITFTLSIALAVVNSATKPNTSNAKNAYATICPLPPPPPPSKRDN